MTEIEFLTPEHPAAEVPVMPRTDHASRLRAAAGPVAAGLWALGAFLAVLAPSHLVYEFRLGSGSSGGSYRPDGWGRLPRSSGGPQQHGLRYGILVCVAAGLLFMAAVLVLLHRARRLDEPARLRLPLVAAGFGLAGVAVLAAVAGEVLLAMQSLRDNIKAQLDVAGPLNRRTSTAIHLGVGAMVWLILLAAACGLVALAFTAVSARGPGKDSAVADPAVADPAHLPADHALVADAEVI